MDVTATHDTRHTPPVSWRPAGLVAVCRGLGLFLRWGVFGRRGRRFLTVLEVVTERLRLTAALTHQAEGSETSLCDFPGDVSPNVCLKV